MGSLEGVLRRGDEMDGRIIHHFLGYGGKLAQIKAQLDWSKIIPVVYFLAIKISCLFILASKVV